MEAFASIISTVGFPIAVCVGLFWFITTEYKEMRQTLEKNTMVINKLATYLEALCRKEIDDIK